MRDEKQYQLGEIKFEIFSIKGLNFIQNKTMLQENNKQLRE